MISTVPTPGPASGLPAEVVFAHDSRRFDGMLKPVVQAVDALEGTPIRLRVFTCLDPSLESEYPTLGVPVRGYRVPFGGDLERGINRWLPIFARRLRHLRADLFHFWSVSLAAAVGDHPNALIAMPDIAKLTTRYYGRLASFLHNRLLHFVPRARGVTCLTEWTRQEIVRVLRLPPEQVFVIPPWTRVSAPVADRPDYAVPTLRSPWELLYVATDRPHKNLAFFLEVLARTDRRFRGVLVTRPTRATLRRARRLGVLDRLEFRSSVDDIGPTYRGARVLLHPSLYEGFGLPVLEAMAQGLPTITSDRTCLPEVVGDGGRVLPPVDAAEWAESVESLVDPAKYAVAASRARARAAQFTRERSRAKLLETYAAAS